MAKKKVIVIGGGFGGVFAAKELERHGRDQFDVELINANNYFVFQPLLPEVAASTIHSADAVTPLRLLLQRIEVRQARDDRAHRAARCGSRGATTSRCGKGRHRFRQQKTRPACANRVGVGSPLASPL